MISTPYGGPRASLFKGVKRATITLAAIAAIGYIGAVNDFDVLTDRLVNGHRQVAEGYMPVELQRRVNKDGKEEYFILYGKDKKELPVAKGISGPILGGIDYLVQNVEPGKLTQSQALKLAEAALQSMEPSQRTAYAIQSADLSAVGIEKRLQYAEAAFNSLEPLQKKAILEAEIARLYSSPKR